MNPTQKYFLYARKSTDDTSHQVRSINDQIAELEQLAEREHYEVVETLIEKQSAKSPGRLVFNAMLERIERGEANGILAWHPDRLARNALDAGRIVYLIDQGRICHLRFPTFPFERGASGKFMLNIMFGQAQYYVDNLGENIKRGHRRKIAEGIWLTHAPLGYLNDRLAKTIYVDPDRGSLVQEVFRLYATGGYTLDQITETAKSLGLTTRQGSPLSRSQLHRALGHAMYCGTIEWKGEAHEGTHTPLITRELFDKVQSVRSRKSKPKQTLRFKPYLFRGLFRCGECGCFITTETQKGHHYLRCTKRVKKDCSQRYVREEVILRQVTATIESVALPAHLADALVADIKAKQERGLGEIGGRLTAIDAHSREIDAKIARLTDGYVSGAIPLNEYQEVRGKLVAHKQTLKDQRTAIEASKGNWFEPAIRFVKASKQASFLAQTGSDTEKREFLRKVGSNLRVENQLLSVDLRGAWKLVAHQGDFAHHEKAAPLGDAAFPHGESRHVCKRRGRDSHGPIRCLTLRRPIRRANPSNSSTWSRARRCPTCGFVWVRVGETGTVSGTAVDTTQAAFLRRRLLRTTLTLLNAIAALAMMGESNQPVSG